MDEALRPVRWVDSALRDLEAFPRAVQREIRQALCAAQCGETYQFGSEIYVLHAFQKKAKQGRKTPQRDMDPIASRVEEARRDCRRRQN